MKIIKLIAAVVLLAGSGVVVLFLGHATFLQISSVRLENVHWWNLLGTWAVLLAVAGVQFLGARALLKELNGPEGKP